MGRPQGGPRVGSAFRRGRQTRAERGETRAEHPEAEKLFAYTREELTDLTVETLLPERFRWRHAEHRAGYFSDPAVRPMREGGFRPDLYFRLAVFPVEIPPLRLRRDDIPLLVWHFVSRKQGRLGKKIRSIPRKVMNALVQYDWPGNVRELENVIERAMIVSPGSSLVLDELSPKPRPTRASDDVSCNLQEIDRAHIVGVLDDCDWRIKGAGNAAERLGLKPSTLRHRMNKLGIHRPRRLPR